MTTLHIINRSPTGDVLASCLRCMNPGDQLLLIEDAVYAVCEPHSATLREAGHPCYVLAPDVAARGIKALADPAIESIDYSGFVALAVENDAVQSWY